ncbi:MAG TPA: ABC transporter substrate-binding protein [Methylophilaceae bacterium]|jgi:peptide/nickel transport system substrate-binding protein
MPLKKFARWASLLLIVAALGACAKPAPHADIRMAVAQAPINLDPRYATDAASERVNRLIYQPLVDFDEHARPIAALASWQILDATHYRFHLRQPGTRFHDGTPLIATDVVATYQSLLALHDSPHTAEFANIIEVKAQDAATVDFALRVPDANFPARLIIGIMPAELIKNGHDFAHEPIGNGPLKFLLWQGTLKLQRVADGQLISLQEVKDPTVRVLKLLRGEADLLQGDLPPELVTYLQRQPKIILQTSTGANFSYIGFNFRDPLLAKTKVRQAIAHAIDRQAIIAHALVAGSREAGAILPPEHWAGNPGLQPYGYDPALSRKLLQQSGIQLPLKLVYKTSTDAQRVRLATILQAQMKPAGIELEIRSLDWGTFFDDIKHGKFQLYGLTWVGIKTPEIYRLAFHSDAVPPKGANRGYFQDVGLDKLIESENWLGATQRIHQQLPYIPLWYEGQFVAMRKGLGNYALKPDGNWTGLATIIRK